MAVVGDRPSWGDLPELDAETANKRLAQFVRASHHFTSDEVRQLVRVVLADRDERLAACKSKVNRLGRQIHRLSTRRAESYHGSGEDRDGDRDLARAHNAINKLVSSAPHRERFEPEHVDWLCVLRDELLRMREENRIASGDG